MESLPLKIVGLTLGGLFLGDSVRMSMSSRDKGRRVCYDE
jgi:hypothetical protein